MRPASSESRRAQPLLGTLVEIATAHRTAARREAALVEAFAAVQRVHRLMSYHDAESDVSRLNRDAARRLVRVDAWTHEVLATAVRLHAMTGGAFDIAVAPALVNLGYLPEITGAAAASGGTTADIELLAGNRVRFRRALQIDLGGIAKGFAVDQAIAALRAAGMTRGRVNAGGDLRVFGRGVETIHVRHPQAPGTLLPLARIRNEALATSALYYSRKRRCRRWVSPLIEPATGQSCADEISVSVRAPSCMLADALTKVLVVRGAAAKEVLDECGAAAMCIGPGGQARCSAPWK